jgi:hypothetical protein
MQQRYFWISDPECLVQASRILLILNKQDPFSCVFRYNTKKGLIGVGADQSQSGIYNKVIRFNPSSRPQPFQDQLQDQQRPARVTMEAALKTFFSTPRFAVVGASSDPAKFGHKGKRSKAVTRLTSPKSSPGTSPTRCP